MAKSIPLPKPSDLPDVVVFHREHPADRRLLLQVPTSEEDAETYIIRLSETEHRLWFERLPNYRALRDKLSYEMHVAFYPNHGGTVMELTDPDAIPWVRKAFAAAHVNRNSPLSRFFARRRLRGRMMPRPRLRSALRFGGTQ